MIVRKWCVVVLNGEQMEGVIPPPQQRDATQQPEVGVHYVHGRV